MANILFVVNNPNGNASDNAVRTQLQALGHTVLTIDDDAVTAADANGRELVIISSTVNSGAVGNEFRNVAVPVLLWENALFDNMGMTSDEGTEPNERDIVIVNSNHPLAGNVPSGDRRVYSSNQTLTWGVPSNNAARIATIDNNSSRYVIFGYTTGASMVGMNAPARRVGFFLEDNGADNLTGTGWVLFNAAINWAMN
jgi:hypothetical protein